MGVSESVAKNRQFFQEVKPFRQTERITLNLAVGGLFFSNLVPADIQPGTMEVDWVKVYRSN